jgi:hypothetical protein
MERSSSAAGDHATCITPTCPSSATLRSLPGSTNTPVNDSLESNTIADNWTVEQDSLLQDGLKKFPNTMEKNEQWANIAKGVPGKSKKECAQRFKVIQEALLNIKKILICRTYNNLRHMVDLSTRRIQLVRRVR